MLNSSQLQDLISKSLRYLLIIGTIAPLTSLEARPVQATPASSPAPAKEAIAPIPAESKSLRWLLIEMVENTNWGERLPQNRF